jgi:hemoglobin
MATIYDEIGGRDGVAAAVDGLYTQVMEDEMLAPYFAGIDLRRLKAHLRAFLATAVGGPEHYAGRDMSSAHTGLDITHEAFDHVVSHLVTTLTALGVAPKTIGQIGGRVAPLRAQIVQA